MRLLNLFTVFLFVIISKLTLGQFSQSIGNVSNNELGLCSASDLVGDSYLGGKSGSSGLITKVDVGGNVLWSKLINIPPGLNVEVSFMDVIGDTLFGCGFVGVGTSNSGVFYFKANKNSGVFYWVKSDLVSNSYCASMRYYQGKYYLVGADRTSNSDYDIRFVCVSSSNGNILFQNNRIGVTFPSANTNYVDDAMAASHMVNGKIFITGRSYTTGASSLNMRPMLIGLDASGAVICQKYLLFPENLSINRFYGMNIDFDGTDSLVVTYFGDDNCSGSCNDYLSGIAKMDLNGNVSFAKQYNLAGVTSELVKYLNITNDAYVISGVADFASTNKKFFAIKTNKNGVVQSTCLVSKLSNEITVFGGALNLGGSSGYVLGNHMFSGSIGPSSSTNKDMFLIQMDDSLNSYNPCFNFSNPGVSTQNFTPFSGTINLPQVNDPISIAPLFTEQSYLINTTCLGHDLVFNQTVFGCDSVQVNAQSSSGTSYVITWPSGSSSSSQTFDTSMSVPIVIYNPLTCCLYLDTIIIGLNPISPLVDLPNDTTFCHTALNQMVIHPVIANCTSCAYLWNDLSISDTLIVDSSGMYSVQVTNSCGLVDSDTIEVEIIESPISTLISDTIICPSEIPIALDIVALNYDSVVWSNGSVGLNSWYYSDGIQFVEIIGQCGTILDSFEITILPLPFITPISNIDTCLVDGGLVSIPISTINSNTDFSNGNLITGSLINCHSDSTVLITSVNQCGVDSLEFNVIVNHFPSYFSIQTIDTCLIEGTPISIYVQNFNGDLLWWNGSNVPSQTINYPGTYYFSVENSCQILSDSLVVSYNEPPSQIILPILDTCLNSDDGILVNIQNFGQNLTWQTNGKDTLTLFESGEYLINVSNDCGNSTDTITTLIHQFPTLVWPDSIITCAKKLNINQLGFEANDLISITNEIGEIQQNELLNLGNYFVTVSNQCGTIQKQFYVGLDFYNLFYAPNAFSPDADEFNGRYEFKGDLSGIKSVEIYNRWGELLYFEENYFSGWDGTYDGVICPDGIYNVKVNMLDCDNNNLMKIFSVSLLR